MKINEITDYKVVVEGNTKELMLVDVIKHTSKPTLGWFPITITKLNDVLDLDLWTDEDRELLEKKLYQLEINQLDDEFYDTHNELLRPYQNQLVDKIRRDKSIGVFWQQRCGKTPLSVVATEPYDKIVIVVPTGLETSWKRSWLQFTDREDIFIMKSWWSPTKRKEFYKELDSKKRWILVVSTSTLTRDVSNGIYKNKSDYLIIDEAHYLRNKTQKTKGTMLLRKLSEHCLALTGTPATNAPEDAIPILMTIKPNQFTKWGLLEYYFNMNRGRFGLTIDGVRSDKEIEWADFLSNHSQVLKTKDVMDWVPEVSNEIIPIEMLPSQEKLYNEMLNKYKYTDKKGKVVRVENVLTQMLKLGQITLDPSIIECDGDGAKTHWLMNWLNENPDEKVIIWSTKTSYIKQLGEALAKHKPLFITGEVPKEERQKQIDILQNSKDRNLMICNITAANTGYTMDKVKTMIFVDRSWNPTENEQANFRFIPTQKTQIKEARTIIDLVCEDTIDEYIRNAFENKLSKTEIVNNFNDWLK